MTVCMCVCVCVCVGLTLEGAGGLLGQGQVVLPQVVDWLVLVDLHAGAHITLPVQEEGEGAGQVFTGEQDRGRETERQREGERERGRARVREREGERTKCESLQREPVR